MDVVEVDVVLDVLEVVRLVWWSWWSVVVAVLVVVGPAGRQLGGGVPHQPAAASSRLSKPPAAPPRVTQYVSPPAIASTTVADRPGSAAR